MVGFDVLQQQINLIRRFFSNVQTPDSVITPHRVPITKKNKIGFVVSIHSDDDKERLKVREDFLVPLRQFLLSSVMGEKDFHFIEFPHHLTSQVRDPGDAEKLRVKTRAHFMIYGRVRERVLDGKEHHIIELDGIVSHKEVPTHIQARFANEFSELFPKRVNISKENDALSFEFTSEWAGIVAEYIIAIAASISGDRDYAEELYEQTLKRLTSTNHSFHIYAILMNRIPIRISELYESRARDALQYWAKTHNHDYVTELGECLDKVVSRRKKEMSILFLMAIHAFLNDRDVDRALGYLKKIKKAATGSADGDVVGIWNYNMAFLQAYKGRMNISVRHYNNAAMAFVKSETIEQVDDFLWWIIEVEPEKYQYHLCLGVFNWKTKGDYMLAKKCFEKFLSARKEGEFNNEEMLVRKWIMEINGVITA